MSYLITLPRFRETAEAAPTCVPCHLLGLRTLERYSQIPERPVIALVSYLLESVFGTLGEEPKLHPQERFRKADSCLPYTNNTTPTFYRCQGYARKSLNVGDLPAGTMNKQVDPYRLRYGLDTKHPTETLVAQPAEIFSNTRRKTITANIQVGVPGTEYSLPRLRPGAIKMNLTRVSNRTDPYNTPGGYPEPEQPVYGTTGLAPLSSM